MQPFDVSCFRPFKARMNKTCQDLRRFKGPDAVNVYNFHMHMMPVYLEAMTTSSIKAGFRRSGIFPFTPNNIDWSKLEGKIKQEEAFHSDESVIVRGKWLAR